jgi:hypothetical protein
VQGLGQLAALPDGQETVRVAAGDVERWGTGVGVRDGAGRAGALRSLGNRAADQLRLARVGRSGIGDRDGQRLGAERGEVGGAVPVDDARNCVGGWRRRAAIPVAIETSRWLLVAALRATARRVLRSAVTY